LVSDAIERREPVISTTYSLRIDDERPQAQHGHSLDNERKPIGQVIAQPTVELHPPVVLPGNHSEAVMLDLVQPAVAGRRLWG
jgi:hypothetical protein